MTQTEVLSRIVNWYAIQPTLIQTLMLLPDAVRDDHDLAQRIVTGWTQGKP